MPNITQTVRVNSSLHPKCMKVFKYKPVMFRKQIMLKRQTCTDQSPYLTNRWSEVGVLKFT